MIITKMAAHPRFTKFLGIKTQHRWVELCFIDQVLSKNKFDSLIEIGTASGGLSVLLGLHALRMNVKAVTFDIRREPTNRLWKGLKPCLPLEFHQLDIYSEEALKIMDEYLNYGRVFLYCDGGVKKRAFNLFAPMLKPNDIIMAHDKGKEIFLRDIKETIEECNLEPFYSEEIDEMGGRIFTFRKAK